MMHSTQEIYTILRRRICREFYPREGTLPSERDIADEFEASRTVIRGILKRLESEHYLEMISPRKRRVSASQPPTVFHAGSRLVGVIGASDFIAAPVEQLFVSQRRIQGIFKRLNEGGLSSLNLSHSWPPAMILEQLAAYKLCGLIYVNENFPLSPEMEELLYHILPGRLPLATFGDTERCDLGEVPGFERCGSDHRQGPLLLLRHLAGHGVRRALWYYPEGNRATLSWQREREAGYREAAAETGVELLPLEGTLPIDNRVGTEENFLRYVRVVAGVLAPHLQSGAPPEAIVVDSDIAVPYFQRALAELGVPLGTIPVAGYDNYYAATRPYQWEPTPPFATVDKNDLEIGAEAVELILRRLRAGEEPSDSFSKAIQPQLIIP